MRRRQRERERDYNLHRDTEVLIWFNPNPSRRSSSSNLNPIRRSSLVKVVWKV